MVNYPIIKEGEYIIQDEPYLRVSDNYSIYPSAGIIIKDFKFSHRRYGFFKIPGIVVVVDEEGTIGILLDYNIE